MCEGAENAARAVAFPCIRLISMQLVDPFRIVHFIDGKTPFVAQYVFNLQQHPVVRG
jgi:hypothetical protein